MVQQSQVPSVQFSPLHPHSISTILALNVSLCSPDLPSCTGGPRKNGPQECPQNRAKLFKLREEERKKKWERGGEGEEEKIPLSGQFLWRYSEDNTVIFRMGGGASKSERAEFYRHSGAHRKVTFERTIVRLFSFICCYE